MAQPKQTPERSANSAPYCASDTIPVYRVNRAPERKQSNSCKQSAGARWLRSGRQAAYVGLLSGLALSCTPRKAAARPSGCGSTRHSRPRGQRHDSRRHHPAWPRQSQTHRGGDASGILVLPDAAAAAQLGANITSGGLVTRFTLDSATPTNGEARLQMELSAPARAELVDGPDAQTVCLRLTPLEKSAPIAVRDMGSGFYDVDAYQADAASLLKSVAQCGHTGVVLMGAVNSRVTVELRQVKVSTAIEMLAKAAGLSTRLDNNLYIVGNRKDLDAAYPAPVAQPAPVVPPTLRQEVYHCNYIHAAELVTTLEKMFPERNFPRRCGRQSGFAPSGSRLYQRSDGGTGKQVRWRGSRRFGCRTCPPRSGVVGRRSLCHAGIDYGAAAGRTPRPGEDQRHHCRRLA